MAAITPSPPRRRPQQRPPQAMPTFCHRSTITDQDEAFGLTLDVVHHLRLGTSDAPTHTIPRPLPPEIDIAAPADFALTLSGIHQDSNVDSTRIQASHPVRHLSALLSAVRTRIQPKRVSINTHLRRTRSIMGCPQYPTCMWMTRTTSQRV